MKSLTLSTLAVLLACNFAEAQTYEIADALLDTATQAFETGDYEKAAENYEKSLEAEKACEVPREDQLHAKNVGASFAYYGLQDMGKSMEFRQESYRLAKKLEEPGSEVLGTEAGWMGHFYAAMGQFNEALDMYLEALACYEKSLGKDDPMYATILNNLALTYFELGEYDVALPLYEEANENTKLNYGAEHADYGRGLNNLAAAYQGAGQYEKALSLYLEALDIYRKGGDYTYINSCLNNLALMYQELGQYQEALPLYQEALENLEKTVGKDDPDYGVVLVGLAALYEIMGNYEDALPLSLEALDNLEKSLGKDHPYYGICMGNLAGLYEIMGQYEKALPFCMEALENVEKTLGKDHVYYGGRLNNLAILYSAMGEIEKALPLYIETMEIIEKTRGKEHAEYANSLVNLASAYNDMGLYDKALPLCMEALENTERSLGKDHSQYGLCLSTLAETYYQMDQYDKALPLYLKTLENTEKSLGKDHAEYGRKLNNLAILYRTLGENDNALSLFIEGMQHTLVQIDQAFAFMSENEKDQFQRTVNNWFDTHRSFFLDYAAQKPEVAAHAFDIELALKGIILESGMHTREALLSSGDSTALAAYENWEIQRRVLSQEYSKPIAERRADLETLEAETEKNEAELTRMSGAFKEASALGSVRWTDVQASLKPDEVAIEFASFRYRNKSATDSVLYVANVLRSTDAHPHMVYLCEQAQLDSIFELADVSNSQFVSSLYRGASPVQGLAGDQTKGARLYKLIWAPLEAYLTPGSTVHYAPSGTLHQVAFAALPTGGDSLLMDRHALVQLSSTAQLIRQGDEKQGAPASMALFGGISYELEQEDLLASAASFQSDQYTSRSLPDDLVRGDNWNYLPGTLKEVEAIRDIAEKRAVQTTLFTGDKAVEESFKSLGGAQSPEVLHISTHGFFFPDPQREQSDAFSESKTVFRASDNPLLRSGLLFAGANRAWRGEALPEGVDDGILTAYEVSHLYLGNTRLVVLSACETGLGDIKGSEGVFGLQRAFKAAGADYLMMSLWKVPDAETAQFMTHFYESWFAGADIATAFHDTQQAMRSLYPNEPYKWAAFVLVR